MTESTDSWKEAYKNDLRPLSEAEQNRLGAVTIVGMRHYNNGPIRKWANTFTEANNAKRCLYLVPDPNNAHDKNAIMLHDGSKLLGFVQASEAPHIMEMLKGSEDVFCVYVTQVGHPEYTISVPTFLRVKAFCKVDERLARKYVCEPNSNTSPSTHKKKVKEDTPIQSVHPRFNSGRIDSIRTEKYEDASFWLPEWKCKEYGFDE